MEGVDEAGLLRLRVRAAPTDGKANEAARRVIAKSLGIGVTRIAIERGHTSRDKQVSVEGVDAAELLVRWPELRLR